MTFFSSITKANVLTVDASAPASPISGDTFKMGAARAPDGRELTVNNISLMKDGKPWLPVMGEVHYARYPAEEWRDELLKMKAGGIDVVATYVFWIHHEEVEGKWDWSGRRSLRDFVKACADVGLPVIVRCGPWCHGEVRNGGLPEWILPMGKKLRTDDSEYISKVRLLYGQIAGQVKGELWKDGGAVIGIQVENEYIGRGEHLLYLKQLAREVGLDVPLYTRTGWPRVSSPIPFGELLPLYGAYAEGFWDRELTPMPGRYWQAFAFTPLRTDVSIANEQLGAREAKDEEDARQYPYLCCEMGGGMMTSYHRRILVDERDADAVALVKLGSGSNLPGYYMYHGGTNPDGQLSYLNEAQSTKQTNYNDLPVKTYDFQAPLGEFGQVRPHYHRLRRLHLFLRDYGSQLATMRPVFPPVKPVKKEDADTVRWSVRSDGNSGFVFVNNYQRLLPMPAKAAVQFEVKLAVGSLRVPEQPVTIPADVAFFWPFNLDLGGAKLTYATAQPICRVDDGNARYAVFAQTSGVPSEFVFDAAGASLESTTGHVESSSGQLRVRDVKPGTGAAISLRIGDGTTLNVVLLDDAASLACWKATLSGGEHVFLTRASMTIDGDSVRVRSENPADFSVAVLPTPKSFKSEGEVDGLFRRFKIDPRVGGELKATAELLRDARPPREVRMGVHKVAEQPSDANFAEAAVWRIKIPEAADATRDLILRVRYQGDVARAYLDGKLLTDNFYNGAPFHIGLKRYGSEASRKELLLKILPLRKGAPIYLREDVIPEFGSADSVARVKSVDLVEIHTGQLGGK
jgi:hypothetical protein